MQNIRVFNSKNNKTYYIAVLDNNSSVAISNIASAAKSIEQVINYSLKKVYPTDITITDINNFSTISAHTTAFTYNDNVSWSLSAWRDSSVAEEKGGVDHFTVTLNYRNITYNTNFTQFTKSSLSNLGSFLKTLIEQAHTHKK